MPRGRDERADVAHLVRRVAFGAPAATIDRLAALGYEGAVDALLSVEGPDDAAAAVSAPQFDTAGYLEVQRSGDEAARRAAGRQAKEERRALVLWWLQRMVAADQPAREKVTLLWHDHFATSLEKVKLAELLYHQRATLYERGLGPFDALVRGVARDPAMLIWLDGRESVSTHPNENFARELFELFTLGHPGHHGGPYDEKDVAEAARALTGWRIDPTTGTGVLDPRRRDPGTKKVLGVSGNLGMDEVVSAATGHPACAPHVVARLWSRLARPATPDDPVVAELAAPFADDLDVAALLRRMLLHDDFLAPATRTALVRTPVDLVVGTCRALGTEPDDATLEVLGGLGQVPFLPPDVAGWPANEAWLSTASARVRLEWALGTAAQVDLAAIRFGAQRAAGLARLLGVERWSAATAAALDRADDPRQALALALVAPEHVVA